MAGVAGLATSAAHRLQSLCCEHYGDSRLVENAHQHGRDLLRSSKHDTFGLTRIFANTLVSGALEERNICTLSASNADKVRQDNTFLRKGVVKNLTSKGYKLPKDTQQMMQKKQGQHSWPSPTPAGLFQSVAATAAFAQC